jgi:hypothetical protein
MRYLFSLPAACMLTACALQPPSSTPQWDRHFGESARIALARQIIEPEAGRNPDPVAGMDGHAARTAYERYQKASSEAAAQPSSFTIGVSGAK